MNIPTKRASIYRRSKKYYIRAISETTAGVRIGYGQVRTIVSKDELGAALLLALEESQVNVPHPHPRDWKTVVTPLLTASGVKTWSAFAKTAACVHAEEEADGTITLVPLKNLGPKEGFEADTSRSISGRRNDVAELGVLVATLLADELAGD